MPTYDYVCDACEHSFEHFQSMSERVLRKCPECGKNQLRRLIGAGAGLIFKGSGFYITDYRGDSYQEAAKKDAPKSDSSEGSGEKKTAPAKSEENGSAKKESSKSSSGSGKAKASESKKGA